MSLNDINSQRTSDPITFLNRGFSTETSPLLVEDGFATHFHNCLLERNRVVKRPGTFVLSSGYSQVEWMDNFNLFGKYNIVAYKQGKSLYVGLPSVSGTSPWKVLNNVFTLGEFFTDQAKDVVPSTFFHSMEGFPTVVFATGSDFPVELVFLTYRFRYTHSGSAATLIIPENIERLPQLQYIRFLGQLAGWDSAKFKGFVSLNGGELQYLDSYFNAISASGDTITLTRKTTPAAGAVTYDFVIPIARVLNYGLKVTGSQVYQKGVRFKANNEDLTIPIPLDLTRDIQRVNKTGEVYPYRLHSAEDTYSLYTHNADGVLTGDTANDFAYSVGGYTVPAAARVQPSPFYVTFAALASTDQAFIGFVRDYKIPFNGIQYPKAFQVTAYDAGKQVRLEDSGIVPTAEGGGGSFSSARSNRFWCRRVTNHVPIQKGLVNGEGTHSEFLTDYVGFNCNIPIGVSPESIFIVANAAVYGCSGITEATVEANWHYYQWFNGFTRPLYGFHQYCDTLSRSFPSIVTQYQGRLVFSGFRHRPNLIIFSELGDASVPGEFFRNFQSALEPADVPTNAFSINVPLEQDDTITAVYPYQNQLFVFSRKALYRIAFSQFFFEGDFQVNAVANIGTLNQRTVTRCSNAVFFMNELGVFNLETVITSDNYRLGMISAPVKKLFEDNYTYYDLNPNTAGWLYFDTDSNYLYCGFGQRLQRNITEQLLIYDFTYQAWYQWTLGSQEFFYARTMFRVRESLLIVSSIYNTAYTTQPVMELLQFYRNLPGGSKPQHLLDRVTSKNSMSQKFPYRNVLLNNGDSTERGATNTLTPWEGFYTIPFPYIDFTTQASTVEGKLNKYIQLSDANAIIVRPINHDGSETLVLFYDSAFTATLGQEIVESPTSVLSTYWTIDSATNVSVGETYPVFVASPHFFRSDIFLSRRLTDVYLVVHCLDKENDFIAGTYSLNDPIEVTGFEVVKTPRQPDSEVFRNLDVHGIANAFGVFFYCKSSKDFRLTAYKIQTQQAGTRIRKEG